jgi:hypothetical protein
LRGLLVKKSFAILGLVFVFACAEGEAQGPDNNGPDAAELPDSGGGGFPDANMSLPDARVFPDAAPIPDAPVGGGGDAGLFCNSSTECTNAGECCFILLQPPGFCVPGTDIGGVCLPAS